MTFAVFMPGIHPYFCGVFKLRKQKLLEMLLSPFQSENSGVAFYSGLTEMETHGNDDTDTYVCFVGLISHDVAFPDSSCADHASFFQTKKLQGMLNVRDWSCDVRFQARQCGWR